MTKAVGTRRWFHAATTFLATAGSVQTALAGGRSGGEGYHHMWGDGLSMMFMGPFMMIVLLAVIVVIAVLAVRWLLPGAGSAAPGASSARIILDERFARGEIEREDYRARCAELEK
ncbi:MAG: hypothetical protein O2967_13745 [Proteobacteria bacterium]|nr:hypothetical protein [Pseudomonadota bacterium]